MKKSIKQLLSAVLVIAMMASLLVVPAAAADPAPGDIGYVWDFQTLKGDSSYDGNSEKTYEGLTFSTGVKSHSGTYIDMAANDSTVTIPVKGKCNVDVKCEYGDKGTLGIGSDTVLLKNDDYVTYHYTGTGEGTVTITRTTGQVYVREIKISEYTAAPSVTLDKDSVVVEVGETETVTATPTTAGHEIYAVSADSDIADVNIKSENEVSIKGKAAGEVTVYVLAASEMPSNLDAFKNDESAVAISVTVMEKKAELRTEWNFNDADLQPASPFQNATEVVEWQGLKVDATKGKLGANGGGWVQFNGGVKVGVPVRLPSKDHVVKLTVKGYAAGDVTVESVSSKLSQANEVLYAYTVATAGTANPDGTIDGVVTVEGNAANGYLGYIKVEYVRNKWDIKGDKALQEDLKKGAVTDGTWQGLTITGTMSPNNDWAKLTQNATVTVDMPAPEQSVAMVTVCSYGAGGLSVAGKTTTGQGVYQTQKGDVIYDKEAGTTGKVVVTAPKADYLGYLEVVYVDASSVLPALVVDKELVDLELGGAAAEVATSYENVDAAPTVTELTAEVPEADKDIVTAAADKATGKITLTPGTKAGKTTVTVSATLEGVAEPVTAEIAVEVIDPNVTPTLWDFSDKSWTSQEGTITEYKGLVMSGIVVNKTYALGKTGSTIAIPVDGPCKVTVSYCYSASGVVGDTAFGTTSGSTGTIESTTGTYTGGKGTAKIIKMTAKSGDDSTYITKIEVEPLEGITPNSVNVWDFGAEELDTSLFVNKLTAENINAQYPEGTEVKTGFTIPVEGFNFYDGALKFNTNAKDNNRLRTTNTAIIRYDEKSLLGAVGADSYLPDEVEVDATSGEVKGGETYTGYVYSNSGSQPLVNLTMQLTAGDKVTFVSGSNGGAEHYELKAPSGAIESGEFLNAAKAEPLTFFAKETGEYTYYGTNEKLVVARIYQEPGVKVTVTGNVDQSLATGLTGAYSVVFTGPGGVETKAPVENGKYTIELNNYLGGADYVVSLEGADGFIVASGEEFSLNETDREGTNDIIVASVDLVEITGKVTGLAEADLANLKLVITKPEGKIYQPKIIPAADGTFTAKFEKGVEYAVEALNVNDYDLAKTKIAYAASGTDDVAFNAKPTYTITMAPDPTDVDLSAATITFTNKDEVDAAHEGGYVYTFTGPKGIKLRDAQYVVEVKGASGIQKLTPDLLVAGADTTCEVPFLNETPTLWDFSDATWTSQSGVVEAYNGLVMSGVQVNKTYALTGKGNTIQIPVTKAGDVVTASFCYSGTGTLGDVAFAANACSGSTGTIETVSYTVKDADVAAGYVTLTGAETAGETDAKGPSIYLTKIEVTRTTPYAETVTVGADKQYKTINEALAAVKSMERTAEQRVTILIDPGDYEEMLRIDTPNVTFKNASATPSIALKNKGVDIDANAVRITSYYGHGYAYYSMESDCTYSAERLAINKANGRLSFENPGTGTTSGSYWNATVRVMASGVRAEGIIFENSFNQYVSKKAAEDVIVKLAGAKEGSVPRAEMKAGDTTVQHKEYVERAAALAIDNNCKEIFFDNCRFVGRQDTLYGGVNSTVGFYNCAVMGGCDYIFGGMIAVFAKCDLVFNTNDETEKGQKDDVGYITAPQQNSGRGYLMYNCHITSTTPGVDTASINVSKPGLLGRPWNGAKSEAVFYATNVDATDPVYYTGDTAKGTSMLLGEAWSSGLSSASGLVGDYDTVEYFEGADTSADRISWSAKFTEAKTADGASMTDTKAWLGDWDAFAGKDMTVVKQTPKPFNAEVLKEELKKAITAADGIYAVAPDTKAEGTAVADVERGTQFVYESDKAALKDAITAAQAVVDNASATTAEVLAAQKALATAVKTFTNAVKTGTKAPNTEALAKAVADAKAAKDGVMISNNTPDKVNQGVTFAPKAALDKLNAALKEAETALASTNATQADVDAAKAALDKAIADFNAAKKTGTKDPNATEEVDKTALDAAIKAAEGVYAISSDVKVLPAGTKASTVDKGQKFVTQDVYDA